MSLVTRIITNTGAPLYRPNGDIASDVRITFELVNPSGMTVDAWDAETGKRVGSKSVAVTTDAGGEFSVALWPNSRGSEPTKYLCTVHSSGYRPFSGVIEDVPQPLPWAAFMAHGTPLTPQELSQLGQYLDEIEQAKDAAEAAAAGATGAVGAALDAHIAAADPHSQYAKDTDLDAHTGDTDNPHGVTPAQIGADPAGAAAGAVSAHEGAPDPHPQYATAGELGAALDGKVDKVVGMGLSAEDYSAADKIKLSGIEVGAQVNVVTSVAGKTGAVALAKADVGLSNADNTSDADKPVSTATATALAGKVDASDPRLTDAREWTAATVDQAEAEAGTDTRRRAWTAQRVFQAVAAWWAGSAAKTKLDGIATGATANATDAALRDRTTHTGTQAISTVTGLQTALDTKVAGPASSVDGQIAVFSGTTGKVASVSQFVHAYPVVNMLKDHGRFDNGKWTRTYLLSDSTFASGIFEPYSSTTPSLLGKFINNNTDFGGAAGTMHPSIVDLINFVGRTGNDARYGSEFNVMNCAFVGTSAITLVIGTTTYYLRIFPTTIGSVLCGNFGEQMTIGYYLRAITSNLALRIYGNTYLDGVKQTVAFEITPASGWRHLQIELPASNGYGLGAISINGLDGGACHLALPYIINGTLGKVIKHKVPIIGIPGAGY